jgi:hypothetical protein
MQARFHIGLARGRIQFLLSFTNDVKSLSWTVD